MTQTVTVGTTITTSNARFVVKSVKAVKSEFDMRFVRAMPEYHTDAEYQQMVQLTPIIAKMLEGLTLELAPTCQSVLEAFIKENSLPYDVSHAIWRVFRKVEDEARAEYNAAKYKVFPHVANKIELGAILTSSWGYDQTNVDFYCVVACTAKTVTLLPMKSFSEVDKGGFMTTKETAGKIDFTEIPLKRKIQYNNSVAIKHYNRAELWDGVPCRASHYA